MKSFELRIVESSEIKADGSFVRQSGLICDLPEEGAALLSPIVQRYKQSCSFYLDKVINSTQSPPWAIACLDREYSLAGHVATTRPPEAGIRFAPYTNPPYPIPDGFVPKVGVLIFTTKSGLKRSVARSPLFRAAWGALSECAPGSHWVTFLDQFDRDWVDQVEADDDERWLSTR